MEKIIKIEKISNYLRKKTKEKYPKYGNTIIISLWEDGDYQVECRCGIGDKIYSIRYHKFSNRIFSSFENMVTNAVKHDEYGNLYYIPTELIEYINQPEKYI